MPSNPFAGWMGGGGQQQKEEEDLASYYRWAGPMEYAASRVGWRKEPTYSLAEPYDTSQPKRVGQSDWSNPQEEPLSTETRRLGGGRELTPGEKLSQTISESIPYRQATMVSGTLADYLDPRKRSAVDLFLGNQGFVGDVRRGASDLIRSIGQSTPQTVADLSGAIADMVTGNTGKGQDYTLTGNKAAKYFNPGGVAQTVGSFIPDIATGVGAFKASSKALTKMAAKSAAGGTGRIGAWAAAGSAEPTALKMFGRAVSPAATRIERAAATAAAAVPTALNVAPEVTAGRMNAAEGALTVALGAAAGPLSAGQWGGRFLTNIAGDVAVNLAAQGATEVVPAIVPGGAQFDAAQVWKNMTYGAAMGAMFGVMNAKPIQGPGDRATFGAKVVDAQAQAAGAAAPGVTGRPAFAGAKDKMVEVVQATEQRMFGQTTIPDNATAEQASARMAEIRSMSPEAIPTLARTPEGRVAAISDQYRSVDPEDAVTQNIVETERAIYANDLAARYKDNPETLTTILDLEVRPGEITPENAQQVLADKITNEWLVQPVDGKGIAGVEERLAQVGAQSAIPRSAAEPLVEQTFQMPSSSFLDEQKRLAAPPPYTISPTAVAPWQSKEFEPPQEMVDRLATQQSMLPDDLRRAAASSWLMPPSSEPLSGPGVQRYLDEEQQHVEAAKNLSQETGIPMDVILPENSVAAKLYEAEQTGVPIDQARVAVESQLAQDPEAFNIPDDKRKELAQYGKPNFAANLARIIQENPEGFTLDPITGQFASSGWAVAPSKATEFRIPAAQFDEGTLAQYVDRMRELIEGGNKVGGWLNSEDNRYYLDIVYIADDARSAAMLARDGDQIGVFHLDELAYHDTRELAQREGILDGDAAGPDLRRVQAEFDRVAQSAGILRSSDPNVPDSFAPVAGFGDGSGGTRRPRKPRIAAKKDSAAEVLSMLEGTPAEMQPEIEVSGASARPNYSLGAAEVETISNFVMENFDAAQDVRQIMIEATERAREQKRELGKRGRTQQEKRAQQRTKTEHLNSAIDMIFNGNDQVVSIWPYKKGGSHGFAANMLAKLEGDGTTPGKVRASIDDGRREFFYGYIELTPTGNPGEFIMKSKLPDYFRENVAKSVEAKYNGESSEVKVAARETEKERRIRLLQEQTYSDLASMLREDTSLEKLAADRGVSLPSGVAFENVSELMQAGGDEGSGGGALFGATSDAGYQRTDAFGVDREAQWRHGYTRNLDKAIAFVDKNLQKLGYAEGDKVNLFDIQQYIVAKTGPGKFSEIGQMYVDNTMSPKVRAILDKEFPTIAYPNGPQRGKAAAPIQNIFDHNGIVDDSYFTARYDEMRPRFSDAMEKAGQLSKALGLNSPQDAYAWVQWKIAMESSETSTKAKAKRGLMFRDNPSFTEEKARAISQAYDDVMKSRDPKKAQAMADAYIAYDHLNDYIKNAAGAEAFKRILSVNAMGKGKAYDTNMRILQPFRAASIATASLLLDESVKEIKEDETYFGIPGSLLKQLLGNGETATYAMAFGGFRAGMKVRMKPGGKQGFRAGLVNSYRRAVDSYSQKSAAVRESVGTGLSTTRESYIAKTPEQRSESADMFMAQFHPTLKPGTSSYEKIKAEKISNEMYAAVGGWAPRNVLDRMRKDKAKGTVSWVMDTFSDPNLMGARTPFVKEYIVDKIGDMRMQIRRVVKEVEQPINDIVPGMMSKYSKNANFWDAFVGINYRMVGLELKEGGVSQAVLETSRNEVIAGIKKDFFSKPDGTLNQEMWDDFMMFQTALNPLRREDLRALYGKSNGVPSWALESHYAELIVRKDRLNEVIGAAQEGYDNYKQAIQDIDKSYKNLVDQVGREGADEMFTGYEETRNAYVRARDEYRQQLNVHKYELKKITKKIENIDTIDIMTDKSYSTFYLNRHRNNTSNFVVRVQFDPKSGVPSVRREYESLTDAKIGQMDILRGAVSKVQADSEQYKAIVKRRTELTDRLIELDELPERTIDQERERASLSNELDKMQGFKPLSEMTDAEVFRFAQDFEILGADATIRDMRRRSTVTKGSTAAQDLIENILSAQELIESQLLTRTLDNGALMRPGSNAPDYVDGKGNAALVDYGASGQVRILQGDEAFTVNELVDQIDDLIDSPVDRKALRELIEKNYMYRDTSKNVKNQTIETVWIDMVAIRNIIEAHTDPYIPNLAKNNNWMGYYDPDGKWTAKQKADWVVKSVETMLSRVHNYNYHTSVRSTIQEAVDWLDRWDINNGLREYIIGLQAYNDPHFKGTFAQKMKEYELSLRRGISFATLAINWGSALGNRMQGATMAVGHGLLNAATKYGVQKTNADGTIGEITWMPTEVAARAQLAKLYEKGETSWKIVEGYKDRPVNTKEWALTTAALMAPRSVLKWLAVQDGYGKMPISQQGKWARVYELSQAANLEQGGVVGSYTVKSGVETDERSQRVKKALGATTEFIERSNNYSSILMSGFDIDARLGISDADWQSMNTDQRTAAVTTALEPHRASLDNANRARELMGEDIAKIEAKIAELEGDRSKAAERMRLQRQVMYRKQRQSRLADERGILLDEITKYMSINRGKDQGDWDKISRSKAERFIESYPGGHLAMTMTAPILRGYNSWMAMQRRIGQTQGTKGEKLKRMSGPALGASILGVMLGARAVPVALGGVFLMDMISIGEMLYAAYNEEDGEKLDKISARQTWENIAVEIGEKYGIEPSQARSTMNFFWDGLFKEVTDINVNAGAGIWDVTGGGTPAQIIPGTGKALLESGKKFTEAWGGTGTPYDMLWSLTTGMPTTAKRVTQPMVQMLPASTGGFGLVKVDKFGQPIYDKDGKLQDLDELDVARGVLFGKPWSETRSKLMKYEGGTPLYTEQDRIAWANALGATKHVSFGETPRGAYLGKGTAEQSNLALFERDAERLQRVITSKYREIRPYVDMAKDSINSWYRDNKMIPITEDGSTSMPFRQILSTVATSGVKAEFEINGSAPDEVRKSMLRVAEEWGRSTAAAAGVQDFYKGRVKVDMSEDLMNAPTAETFALYKLGSRFSDAYSKQFYRQEGRRNINR